MRHFSIPLLLLLATPALAQSVHADHEAIDRVNQEFMRAFSASDAGAIAALYTDDALFLAPGMEPLSGHEQIRAFLGGAIEAGISRLALDTGEIDIHGDVAHEVGTYRMYAGDQLVDRGNYMVVWQRGDDGVWRLHRDMINSTMPAGE
jgi:uncharacterized protein (TIGR02246 family)